MVLNEQSDSRHPTSDIQHPPSDIRHRLAWRAGLRRVGWWPVAGCAGLLAAGFVAAARGWGGGSIGAVRVVELVLPLVAGMHAAFLFSPEDEPPLELLAAAPRSLAWLVLERLAWLLGLYGALGLAATAVQAALLGETAVFPLIWRWLPPLLWFSGVGLFMTLLARQGMLSMLLLLLTWGGLLLAGGGLLATCPLLLPLHVFLQPAEAAALYGADAAAYAANRWQLALTGGLLLALAANLARDEARLLGDGSAARARRQQPPAMPDRLSLAWLLLGLALLTALQLDWRGAAAAAWLAPIFLLRFVRTQHADVGLAWVWAGGTAVAYGAWLGRTALGDVCHAVYAGQQAAVLLLPLAADRLLWPRWHGRPAGMLLLPLATGGVALLVMRSIAYSQVGEMPLLPQTAVLGSVGAAVLAALGASGVNWVWEEVRG